MAELKIIKMSDIQPEPVEWLWEPYIPMGAISLMQGDGAAGKTTTALAIAAAITKGEPLPGSNVFSAPANVVVQNAEDSYSKTIRPRLERFGANCDMVHVIDEDEQALSLSDGRIEQTVIETNAKLLIIDPLQAYLGGANMNSANGVRPLMKQLGTVAAQHGCAVLLVGHLHKAGGKAAYRGLGSIDIYAAARSVLTVGKIGVDENMRAIVQNKSNFSSAGIPQAFELDSSGMFMWMGDCDVTVDDVLNHKEKPESQFSKARRMIEMMLANGPAPSADVKKKAEEWGISEKTLNRAKAALGVISARRGGHWHWVYLVDVEYAEADQDGQHGQGGHEENVTALTILQNGMEG